MSKLEYKIGDRVKIKSLDWYNKNKDVDDYVHCGDKVFDNYMSVFCGSVVTISGIYLYNGYDIQEDLHCRTWTDEMIECLVEPIDCKKCGLTRMSTRCLFMDLCPHNKQKNIIEIPKDYVLKDENGNVINATKIVLEKKKKEYPKTYEECAEIIAELTGSDCNPKGCMGYMSVQLTALQKLLICRNAYWKIAGEEMSLGKPWEPDWKNDEQGRYTIMVYENKLHKDISIVGTNFILVFPTEEMRDAFYENFKDLIEECKEFL